jgi:hypothetical protein
MQLLAGLYAAVLAIGTTQRQQIAVGFAESVVDSASTARSWPCASWQCQKLTGLNT